jgi:peptide/nickel transport system ATP-binding protein
VAGMADRLVVMRNGAIVESGEAPAIFRALRHPYSRSLLAAATYRRTRPARARSTDDRQRPLLQVEHVIRAYGVPSGVAVAIPRRPAVNDVSFTIRRGENVALVGESGSGKSTLARVVLALDRPRAGRVLLNGIDFHAARGPSLRDLRRHIQAVFQDPYGSFDPRAKVWRSIAEPLVLDPAKPSRGLRRTKVDDSLVAVGLSPGDGDKYPHEFSGGERQRLAVARALITRPSLIVLDEPVSALDVSIRGEVLDLLADIAERFGVSYLFISHDLAVVRAIADRVLVMREGRIVEEGPTEDIFARPQDPYTAALVAAIPDLERTLARREPPRNRV